MIVKSYRRGKNEIIVTRNDDERLHDENRFVALRIIEGQQPDYMSYLDMESALDITEDWFYELEYLK